MTPELRARVTARNETAAGFAEVQRDAVQTANVIEASGRRATTALVAQNNAMNAVGASSRNAAFQQRNLVFQLNDVGVSLASGMNPLMVFAQQGSQIATIYGAEEGGLGMALKQTMRLLGPFAAAAAVVGTVVAGVTNEINKTSDVTVTMGDVAKAAFSELAEGIYREAAPAVEFFGNLWDQITPGIKDGVNFMISSFVTGYDNIKTYWSMLPAALGDITISTANNVLTGVEQMINGSLGQINSFLIQAKGSLGPLGQLINPIGEVDFGPGLDNPFAGAGEDMQGQLASSLTKNFSTDWLAGVGEGAEENALARLAEEAEKAAKGAKSAADAIDPLKSRVAELADVLTLTRDPFEQMKLDLTDIQTLYDMGRISAEQFGQATFKTMANTAASTLGVVGQLTGAMSQLFADNKAFAVANAVVNTAEGITKALAQGGMLGFIGAAAVATAGAAQIASILSANPGSSSAPSAGSAPAASAPVSGGGGQALNISLHGPMQRTEDVEALVRRIVSYFDDRDQVLVTAHK